MHLVLAHTYPMIVFDGNGTDPVAYHRGREDQFNRLSGRAVPPVMLVPGTAEGLDRFA